MRKFRGSNRTLPGRLVQFKQVWGQNHKELSMSMSSQIATLIGVFLGGLLSFLSSYFLYRSNQKREEIGRWMTARLDAYTAYVQAVKRVTRTSRAIQSSLDRGETVGNLEQNIADLALYETDRSLAFERVVLLGSQRTINLAMQVNQAVWDLETPSREGVAVPESERKEHSAHWLDKMNAFHLSARDDLRVGGTFNPDSLRAADQEILGNLRIPGAARPKSMRDASS